MKGKTDKSSVAEILEKVTNGLIEENSYYHCEISSDWSTEDGGLLESLSNAVWVDALDQPIPKNEQRGVNILSQLQSSINVSHAVAVGVAECSFSRENKSEVSIDSKFQEKEVNVKDLPLQLTPAEYRKLLQAIQPGHTTEKKMSPIVIKCKTLPQVPKCDKCDGRGLVSCDYCHGYGDGECPDCKGSGMLFPDGKFGEEHQFYNKIGYYQHYQVVLSMDECPSCKGTGEIHCSECGGKGEVTCEACHGSGKMGDGKSAQKVTRMIEKYCIDTQSYIVMPDGGKIDFDPYFLRDEIVKSTPVYIAGTTNTDVASETVESTIRDCSESAYSEIKRSLSAPDLFALNVVAHRLDQVSSVTFTYDSKEYQILILGTKAFASELPEISFLEKLLGTYKKKMS